MWELTMLVYEIMSLVPFAIDSTEIELIVAMHLF